MPLWCMWGHGEGTWEMEQEADRQIFAAHWPDSLVYLTRSRQWDALAQKQVISAQETTPEAVVWPPFVFMHTGTHTRTSLSLLHTHGLGYGAALLLECLPSMHGALNTISINQTRGTPVISALRSSTLVCVTRDPVIKTQKQIADV